MEQQPEHHHHTAHFERGREPEAARAAGKVHWHDDQVYPVAAEPIVHKNPAGDLYELVERRHPARDVELPMRTINLHVGRLNPGGATRLHKHHNEAVIYIIQGQGYSDVQGKRYRWEAGDFLYVPVFNWHTHVNDGDEPVLYLGITNKRMLDYLALDRMVQAGIDVTEEDVAEEIRQAPPSRYSDPAEAFRSHGAGDR